MKLATELIVYRCLLLAFWTSFCIDSSGALTVITEKRVIAFLARDVLIPCNISGYGSPELDTTKTAVEWYRKTAEDVTEKDLFSLVPTKGTAHRNGTRMNVDDLRKGNAALFLPEIQLNEEGMYRCVVIVTPSRAEATTTVEIIAQPVVTLSPEEVTIQKGQETTLTCAVKKFYPGLMYIYWEKNSKQSQHQRVSAGDICTESALQNSDGTFNVTSKVRHQPSSENESLIYSCIIRHKSFTTPSVFSATVTVTDPPRSIHIPLIVEVVLGLLFCTFILIILHVIFCKRVPPQITSPLVETVELKHSETEKFRYKFSGFRPKKLDLNIFLITPSSNGKEKIFSWQTKATRSSEEDGEEDILLLLQWKDVFTFVPKLRSKQRCTFDLSCLIVINPDVKKLDKFALLLEVKHVGFPGDLYSETKQFRVIALPVLDKIICLTDVPRGELLKLSCTIRSYFPEIIEVVWYKDGSPVVCQSEQSVSIRGSDGLFSCDCRMSYKPQTTDIGKTFSCKAKLKDSQQCKECSWQMEILAFPPKASQIHCESAVPACGKPITLSCLVTDFYPSSCDICWRKGFEPLTDGTITTEEPQLDKTSNLYRMKSQVSFIPNANDHAAYIFVEVEHKIRATSYSETVSSNKYQLMLKGFPIVKNIMHEPRESEYGSILTLSCQVLDFYPRDITVQWLDEDGLIRDGVATKEPVEASSGFFRLSSTFQLIPTALDFDKTIHFRVIHEKLVNPVRKKIHLQLPVKTPVLSEIKATSTPEGDIVFELSISNFAPCDICVVWYKDREILSENINPRNIQIGENKLGSYTSQIKFAPKSGDFEKTIRCEVFHRKEVQEKHFRLKGTLGTPAEM